MKINKPANRTITIIILLLIVGALYAILLYQKKTPLVLPPINQTLPQNNSSNVLPETPIEIHFSQPLSSRQQNSISLQFTPSIDRPLKWTDDQTLEISPSQPLNIATYYQIQIKYQGQVIYTLSFTTTPFTEKLRQQIQDQAQDDFIYGQAVEKFNQQYPWYKKLPIITNDYSIGYDFDRESFRIRFSSDIPPNQHQQIINDALNDLKNIGVNINNIKYYTVP